jgi:hypothetical protein
MSLAARPSTPSDEAPAYKVDGEVLDAGFINELLAIVDRGEADDSAQLSADRERLQHEVNNLLDVVVSGVSPATLAPKIKEREMVRIQSPRPTVPENIRELGSFFGSNPYADLMPSGSRPQ